MIETDDEALAQKLHKDLLSYCKLDTLAMVKLLEHVRSAV